MSSEHYAMEIDARGKNCPLPVIYAKKALEKLKVQQMALIICMDLKAGKDIELLCKKHHQELVRSELFENTLHIVIKKITE